jgi:glycosyltransferase involved in cell wall biosynthesis
MDTLLESVVSSPKRSKTLRVVFITTTVSGVGYYRMAAFAWQMRKWPKVETVVWPYSCKTTVQNPWQVDLLSNPEIQRQIDYFCEKADVVVWQALDFNHSLALFEEMRTRHQKPFLMELDDYIPDIPHENEAFEQYRPGSVRYRVMLSQLRQSDALIVSTPYLKQMYKEFHPNIHVMPNSIDLPEWKHLGGRKHSRLRIGWIGGGTHGRDLEMVFPVIEELLQKYKDLWFYCIHGCPEVYKRMAKVYWTRKWATINLYPRFMDSFKFDIGVAPLIDNNFNRGKSNLRWLEYSALKLPSVCSPRPDFDRSISNGVNGFLAESPEEWKAALEKLIEDESLRRTVGLSAYQSVFDQFNVTKTSRDYLRLLKEIAA